MDLMLHRFAGAITALTLLVGTSLPIIAWSADYPQVAPEPFRASLETNARATRQATRLLPDLASALSIQLAPLAAEEASLPTAVMKRVTVGIGRSLDEHYRKDLDSAGLVWQSLADGGHSAMLSVSSAGAAALRLEVLVRSLPAEAELAFFAPASGEVLVQLAAREVLASNTGQLWSPIVEGDGVGLQINLPAGVDPARVDLGLGGVSHFPAGHPARKQLSDIGNSGACNVDVACSEATPQNIVDSVAKYAFTGPGGFSYLCSGTLMNDTDLANQVPYFLTAQHCVSSPAEAASMEFYWFFQRSQCGGPAPSSVVTQRGGATLLVADFDSDHSLVLLNQAPPAGVTLSGWSARPVAANSAVTALHHPYGDLKKISLGVVQGAAPYLGSVDGAGDYLQLRWNLATTEPGSSGSGIFQNLDGGGPYLVGLLSGGLASCQAQNDPDWYGRFDRAFPLLESYLASDDGLIPASFTGLWFDPSLSGQAIQLIANGNLLGGAWYLYDETGEGQWLTFVGQTDAAGNSATSLRVELLRFTGPALGSPWNQAQVDSQVVGELTLSLIGPTQVRADYQLGNVSGVLNLSPYRSGASGPSTGIWYEPSQSGRGLQLVEQDGLLEGVWYLYDANGEGFWVTFQAPLVNGRVSADLWRFTGPLLGTPYNPDLVAFSTVGTVSVELLDPDRLFFSYQIDGVQENLFMVPFELR